MKALVQHEAGFIVVLKSAAGFAIAAMAIVGMLLGVAGVSPADAQWLLYVAALVGAIGGTALGVSGAGK